MIEAGLRAPDPGAPLAYVTTRRFLEAFGLGSLRELPSLEQLEEEGLTSQSFSEIDAALGVSEPG